MAFRQWLFVGTSIVFLNTWYVFYFLSGNLSAPKNTQDKRTVAGVTPIWDPSKCNDRPFEQVVRQVTREQSKQTTKTRVLVTGAAGFIGSHVARFCRESLGFDTVAVDDLSGGFMRNVPSGTIFQNVDMKDAKAVDQVFKDHGPFDYVYHLAAYAAEGLSHFIRNFNYRNNLEATTNIVNSAVRSGTVSCIIFTSSIASFGNPESLPLLEESVRNPEDPYGIAKYAAEVDLKVASTMFGIDHIVYYPHNVYGPGQNIADKFRNAVGIFMNQILKGESMTIFGSGNQTRGFSYIDDVAPLIAIGPVMQGARNQSFFVGVDDFTSVYDLSVDVAAAMNVPHTVQHLPARNEVVDAYASHDKLRCFFNPPAPVPLSVGLVRTAIEVEKLGKHEPTGFSEIEVWKNMPPSWVKALRGWQQTKKQEEANAKVEAEKKAQKNKKALTNGGHGPAMSDPTSFDKGKVTVLFGIETCNAPKYVSIVDAFFKTWAKNIPRKQIIMVSGNQDDATVGLTKVPLLCKDIIGSLSCKETVLFYRAAERAKQLDAHWLMVLQEDKYVYPAGIERHLRAFDHTVPQAVGSFGCGKGFDNFCADVSRKGALCGGNGYFISRAALDMIVQGDMTPQQLVDETKELCPLCSDAADVTSSCLFYKRGIPMVGADMMRNLYEAPADINLIKQHGVRPLGLHINIDKSKIPAYLESLDTMVLKDGH